jgi:hypothetical protein
VPSSVCLFGRYTGRPRWMSLHAHLNEVM